jgi:DNA-binding transcriptional ArsR family regulator
MDTAVSATPLGIDLKKFSWVFHNSVTISQSSLCCPRHHYSTFFYNGFLPSLQPISNPSKAIYKPQDLCFPMADKKFLMLSLEEKETKKVANVISNESCRKILDYLATKESTASELSEKLSIPLSTITYNIQQLVDTGLVSADEFHYSQKGKEVLHYKLANKYIIITPKAVTGIKDKLRKILPIAFISAGAAGIVQLVYQYVSLGNYGGEAAMMAYDQAAPAAMMKSADASLMMASEESLAAQAPAAQAMTSFPFDIALWFFVGALFGAIIYMAITTLNKEQ